MNSDKKILVGFADQRLRDAYEKLKSVNPILYSFIDKATDRIKADPECGTRIPKRLIPKFYIKRDGITNLWKYNLPGAWRLIYSIQGNELEIIAIILEWMPHRDYERRFNY